MTNQQRETQIKDALSSLRNRIEAPPIEPEREQALLAAFDTHWARPRPGAGRWIWTTAAAALIAMTVALGWLVVTTGNRQRATDDGQQATSNGKQATGDSLGVPEPEFDLAGFVPWPGAQAWPRFESGQVMRVDLPVSLLPALGLSPLSFDGGVVRADIVVGQDGLARAFRLVQQ